MMTGYSNTVYFVINSRLEAGCVYVARLYTSFSSSFIRYFTSKYWLLSFLFQGVVKKLGEIKTTVSCLNEYSFAGKAVFCEKPITSDTDSTASSYDLAERQKQPLFCAFHRYLISFVYCSLFSYVTNYTLFFFSLFFWYCQPKAMWCIAGNLSILYVTWMAAYHFAKSTGTKRLPPCRSNHCSLQSHGDIGQGLFFSLRELWQTGTASLIMWSQHPMSAASTPVLTPTGRTSSLFLN